MSLLRAKDLKSLKVDIELIKNPNLAQIKPVLDIAAFYANIISFDEYKLTNGVLDIDAT